MIDGHHGGTHAKVEADHKSDRAPAKTQTWAQAVAIKDLMVVFGGGNEGIVDELHVYNTGKLHRCCASLVRAVLDDSRDPRWRHTLTRRSPAGSL